MICSIAKAAQIPTHTNQTFVYFMLQSSCDSAVQSSRCSQHLVCRVNAAWLQLASLFAGEKLGVLQELPNYLHKACYALQRWEQALPSSYDAQYCTRNEMNKPLQASSHFAPFFQADQQKKQQEFTSAKSLFALIGIVR